VLAVRVCLPESDDPINRRSRGTTGAFLRHPQRATSIGLPKKAIKSHNNARRCLAVTSHRRENFHRFQGVSAVTGATLDLVLTFQLVVAIVIALLVAYNVFYYVLFLLVT
jgi:hypothetical protein